MALLQGKIRALCVRPIQSSDLAFGTHGIIGMQNHSQALLGSPIKAFDISSELLPKISTFLTINGRPELDSIGLK